MKRTNMRLPVLVLVILCLFAQTAHAYLFSASGTSGKGVEVSFNAQLSIAEDTLTIILTNNSPVSSLNPDDALGSFYFDIVNEFDVRPTLTWVSATGDVYLGDKDNPDTLITAGANLMALSAWDYDTMNPDFFPYLGFGIGAVGNNNLSPNGFDGSMVDGPDYTIYKDEVTTSNLQKLLVKNTATFVFSGVSNFDEGDISEIFLFGLGTAPDSYFHAPLPGSLLLGALGLSCVGWRLRRRRTSNM